MAIRLSNNFTTEVLENIFAPVPQALFYSPLHSRRRTAARLCPHSTKFQVSKPVVSHGISIQKAA